MMMMSRELGRMCEDVVVALAPYLLGENEESHAHRRKMAGVWVEIQKSELAVEMRDLKLAPRCR
jgi:hypothetical protein